jgi:hypothetical protein
MDQWRKARKEGVYNKRKWRPIALAKKELGKGMDFTID